MPIHLLVDFLLSASFHPLWLINGQPLQLESCAYLR